MIGLSSYSTTTTYIVKKSHFISLHIPLESTTRCRLSSSFIYLYPRVFFAPLLLEFFKQIVEIKLKMLINLPPCLAGINTKCENSFVPWISTLSPLPLFINSSFLGHFTGLLLKTMLCTKDLGKNVSKTTGGQLDDCMWHKQS